MLQKCKTHRIIQRESKKDQNLQSYFAAKKNKKKSEYTSFKCIYFSVLGSFVFGLSKSGG